MKLTLNPDALAVESFSVSASLSEWTGAATPTTVNSRPYSVCCVNTV
jgi:hypothetical protein